MKVPVFKVGKTYKRDAKGKNTSTCLSITDTPIYGKAVLFEDKIDSKCYIWGAYLQDIERGDYGVFIGDPEDFRLIWVKDGDGLIYPFVEGDKSDRTKSYRIGSPAGHIDTKVISIQTIKYREA